jgi:toxin-antitoxin system PIN domain toxin
MTPDVNVLVAASRSDHPHHAVARDWLAQAVKKAQTAVPLTLQPMVTASFLRLVTHPKIFVNPTPITEAVRFVEVLLSMPGISAPTLGQEWPALCKLCAEKGLSANDLPDAWLAAAVIHQGEHLVTFDQDFRRLLTRSQLTRLESA